MRRDVGHDRSRFLNSLMSRGFLKLGVGASSGWDVVQVGGPVSVLGNKHGEVNEENQTETDS